MHTEKPIPAPGREPEDSAADAAVRLGARLRARRIARNLTIAELAEASGLTKGFISRLERDQTSVSIAALLRICDVLQKPIGMLFEAPATSLVRGGAAPVIDFGCGVCHAVQTPSTVESMRVIRIELAPGASAPKEEYVIHKGSEFVQILKGAMVLELESESFRLRCGDSITFPGRTPHTYRNASRRERCEALWVIAPAP